MAMPHVILVAEDEDNDFFLLESAFAKYGKKVLIRRARDGVEAINYLEGRNGYGDRLSFPFPDLMVLDLKMPRKTGFEVLEWLQKNPALKALIVVVMSYSRHDNDVTLAYKLGANSYLMKPSGNDEFIEMIRVFTEYWVDWSERPELALSPPKPEAQFNPQRPQV